MAAAGGSPFLMQPLPHRPKPSNVVPSPGTKNRGTLKHYGHWGSNKSGEHDDDVENGLLHQVIGWQVCSHAHQTTPSGSPNGTQ